MGRLISKERIKAAFSMNIPGGTLWRCSMMSDILRTEKSFTVYLPQGYDDDQARRYPAMYLFHPAGGTDMIWVEMGQFHQIADDAVRSGMALPMIVVIPDARGMNGNYLGKRLGYFSVPDWDYEAYFHQELIPLVDGEFRTVADKRHRAIAGPSMGGEAAVAYAQKYPEFYGSACALSGILGKPEQSTLARTDKDYAESLIRNNPSAYVANATVDQVEALRSVRWYADCGDNDFFCEGNVEFFLNMKKRGVPLSFRMRSGVHGFYYWITGMPELLRFVSAGFAAE